MKILGSPVFTIIFAIVFMVCLYRYWNLLKAFSFRFRVLLFSIRIIAIAGLLVLLINPWIDVQRHNEVPQKLDVIFDHSESLKYHYEKGDIQSNQIRDKIDNWGSFSRMNLHFYRMGDKIEALENMEHYNSSTDFSRLPEFMSYELPHQLLLITDGRATVGREINDLIIPDNIPVHVLGVGPLIMGNDIFIEEINVPTRSMRGDTVALVLKLRSQLTQPATTKLQILNDRGENIYDAIIHYEPGSQNIEMNIPIAADKFSGINKAILLPLKGESKIENNQHTFRVAVQPIAETILLISGALSSNTAVIKSTLNTIDEGEVMHFFKIDAMRWNEESLPFLDHNPKMIILDDFPGDRNDKTLFDDIVSESNKQNVSIVYIEGPKSDLSTAEMIRNRFPAFIPSTIDSETSINLSDESLSLGAFGVNLSGFPPQKRSVKWTTDEDAWVYYSDGSFMVASISNLFVIASPNIAGNHLKTKSKTSSISNLMRSIFLRAYYGNDGFLDLYINGASFNKGELISVKVLPVQKLGLRDLSLVVINSDADTIMHDCKKNMLTDEFNCSLAMHISGEYAFQGEAVLSDGEKIRSNVVQVIVQDVNIELKNLTQDQKALMRVAHNSGGNYMDIESLDSMLTRIEITPIQLTKNYHLSGLSTQQYWWILIILLAVEWFLRKKLGLL